mgnify:CR=1 FL=1
MARRSERKVSRSSSHQRDQSSSQMPMTISGGNSCSWSWDLCIRVLAACSQMGYHSSPTKHATAQDIRVAWRYQAARLGGGRGGASKSFVLGGM